MFPSSIRCGLYLSLPFSRKYFVRYNSPLCCSIYTHKKHEQQQHNETTQEIEETIIGSRFPNITYTFFLCEIIVTTL